MSQQLENKNFQSQNPKFTFFNIGALFINVHKHLLEHYFQKVGGFHLELNECMVKQGIVHPQHEVLLLSNEKWLTVKIGNILRCMS